MKGQQAVVAGGCGQVGRLLVDLLGAAGVSVRVVDVAAGEDIVAIGPALEEALPRADLVALALPEPVALAAVPGVLARMRPDALLVETLSVKTHIAAVIEEQVGEREALGINPMFAPGLGLHGRPIALIPYASGRRSQAFEALLVDGGARTVPMSVTAHDRCTAILQAATHSAVLAFGFTLAQGGVDIATLRQLAPPPHEALLLLLARITQGAPDVYWDIQAGNPEAAAAREALQGQLAQISHWARTGDAGAFRDALEELRSFLGEERPELAARRGRLFSLLPNL